MSEKFVILADCTCDLSEEIRKDFGINDYISGYVSLSDGRDFRTTLDFNSIEREEFYKLLTGNKVKISTAPASPEEYYLTFKKYAEQGINVLSMSISSTISSTYSVAKVAADRVKAEFPDVKLYCFDSMRMSGAFGLLVMYAYDLQRQGKTYEEVIAWLEENKLCVHQMGPIDDLIFVARRGRISMGKAIMGSFAGVKPMGDCDVRGYVSVLGKAKGMKKALEVTANYVKRVAVDVENQYVLISHSDREKYAYELYEKLSKVISPKKIYVSDVFTGSGANAGPGMIGVYFLGKSVTEDLSDEKAALTELLEKAK